MRISIIVAMGINREIGANNQLLWNLPIDMKFFKETTVNHHVLMGRKTYESIPKKFRPLPNRINLVLSNKLQSKNEDMRVIKSLEKGIEIAQLNGEEELFIIGGATVYAKAIELADRIYITHVNASFKADAFFPALNLLDYEVVKQKEHKADQTNDYDCTFAIYDRIR